MANTKMNPTPQPKVMGQETQATRDVSVEIPKDELQMLLRAATAGLSQIAPRYSAVKVDKLFNRIRMLEELHRK